MNGCIIKHWQNRPIPGGWGLTYSEGGQTWSIQGQNPGRVVAKIVQVQTVNGTFVGEEPIWDYCNAIWAQRSPDRAQVTNRATSIDIPKPSITPSRGHWEHGPEKFGPILWFWLHSFGMVFDKEHWRMAINRIGFLLDPGVCPKNGCEKCFSEWKVIMATEKPYDVSNEKEAAEWSWKVHNRINKKLGKRQFAFSTAAKMYGWKVDL